MKNLRDLGYSNYFVTDCGRVYSDLCDKFLKPRLSSHGYFDYSLKGDNGKRKTLMAHRIVADAFLPFNEEKKVVHLYCLD